MTQRVRKIDQTYAQPSVVYLPAHGEQGLLVVLGALLAPPKLGRELQLAPLFGQIENFLGCPFTHERRGCGYLLPATTPALFIKVLKQIFHNFFKASHKTFSFFADHYSEDGVQNFAKELQKSEGA